MPPFPSQWGGVRSPRRAQVGAGNRGDQEPSGRAHGWGSENQEHMGSWLWRGTMGKGATKKGEAAGVQELRLPGQNHMEYKNSSVISIMEKNEVTKLKTTA